MRPIPSLELKTTTGFDDRRVLLWWLMLNTATLYNLCCWWLAAPDESVDSYRRLQWRLSGVYSGVCAFRALLPRIDLERLTIFDTWVSSVFLGRSAATVAEVAFAVQCAVALDRVADHVDLAAGASATSVARVVAVVTPYSLTIAQVFCWASVISGTHLWHAVEESLWGLTYAGVLAGLAQMYSTGLIPPQFDLFFRVAMAATAAFVVFMALVDVPMYVRRWRQLRDTETTRGFIDGVKDCAVRRVVSSTWRDWAEEMPWLSGYFIGAVALSQQLQFIPPAPSAA